MAIQQPVNTDKLSSPDHSLSHRVFANDDSAPVQTITVDASGVTKIGDADGSNYLQIGATGLAEGAGTGGISLPYGSFSDSTTQTITGETTQAYAIKFNTDEAKHHITHSTVTNNSRIYLDVAGTYLITFSAVGKSSTPNATMDIWLAVGGSSVARSNTLSRFVGSANERIITVTYIYTFTANQYFELYWASNNSGTTIVATAEQSNPTRPACPSIIITVNMISKD